MYYFLHERNMKLDTFLDSVILDQKGKNHVLRSSYLKGISFDLLFFRGWNISSFWKFEHVPYGSPSINWTLRRLFSSLHSAPKKWLLLFPSRVTIFLKKIIIDSFVHFQKKFFCWMKTRMINNKNQQKTEWWGATSL